MSKTDGWMKAYIASPFFSPEENFVVEKIERICEERGIQALSPRKFMVLKPGATLLERKQVFEDNIRQLNKCSVVLANIEGYDAGTLWEMGYAYAIGRPVIAMRFSGKSMNVMLACGTEGFIENWDDLEKFLTGHATGPEEADSGKFWDFNWEVAKKWFKSIY